jgi:hypothetical protein
MFVSIFLSLISVLLNILLSVSQPLKTFFSCDQTSGGKLLRRNLGFSFIFQLSLRQNMQTYLWLFNQDEMSYFKNL